MSIIKVENLSKEFKTYSREANFKEVIKSLFVRKPVYVKAVDDISFTIEKGAIVGILGKNGAGKSTLIKMMTGVLTPTSGVISSLGFEPSKQRSKYVSRIGAVFGQKSQLIWDIPPADSFLMNKAIYNIPDSNYSQILDEMVTAFEIGDVIKRPTRVLSLGERMKCEFVMAMLHNPEIVFLDEPTIGLDIIAKETIRDFVRKRNALGTTFILTTHDLDDVERLADKVIVINEGKLVFNDSLPALLKHLGNKHILKISSKKALSGLDWSWANITAQPSDSEIVLMVDNDIFPLSEMVKRVSDIPDMADISIDSLPVEEIVQSIYQQKKTDS